MQTNRIEIIRHATIGGLFH